MSTAQLISAGYNYQICTQSGALCGLAATIEASRAKSLATCIEWNHAAMIVRTMESDFVCKIAHPAKAGAK